MSWDEYPEILRRAACVTLQNYVAAAVIVLILSLAIVPWWMQWCFLYALGFFCLCSVLGPFVEDWRPKPRVCTEGKAVFISGCDSGFGHCLAERLDGLGLHVFAGCLFPEKEGAQSLKKKCSERLHILPLDVRSEESVQKAVKFVNDNIGSNCFWALVNNAGVTAVAEMAYTPLETVEYVFQVNTFGVVRLVKAFLPLLCTHKGRIVTVSSAVTRIVIAGLVAYCMTKHAVSAFLEGLRIEMYRFGVKIIAIEPFLYKTPMADNSFRTFEESWNKSPNTIREMYPEGYMESMKRTIFLVQQQYMNYRVHDVICCLEEAILAVDPKYVYRPGSWIVKLKWWILSTIPKTFRDVFAHKLKFLNKQVHETYFLSIRFVLFAFIFRCRLLIGVLSRPY